MNWFYAAGGQQQGPVDEAQLDALIASGQVKPDTLVWREGMANWQPLRDARPTSGPSPASTPAPPVLTAAAGEVACVECGKSFARDNAIQYGTTWVCANCKPVFLQRLREGATPSAQALAAGEVTYAGFWIRFVAKFIDGLILAIPGFVLGFGGAAALGIFSGRPNAGFVVFQAFLWVLDFAIRLGYNTFFVGKYGATPGKMAVGLKVIMADRSEITYPRALGRAAAEIINAFTCLIGYIIAGFDNEKRALHDHICSTRVIYK